MIGVSFFGVIFIFVLGWVGQVDVKMGYMQGFVYLQMVMGYMLGYVVIVLVFLLLYYCFGFIFIYEFLE